MLVAECFVGWHFIDGIDRPNGRLYSRGMNIQHLISQKHLWLGSSPAAVVFPFS